MTQKIAEIKRLQKEFVKAVNAGTDTTRILTELEAVRAELKRANVTARQKTSEGLTTREACLVMDGKS